MAELGTTTVCAGRNNRSVNPQQQDVGKINEFVVWGVWKMLCRSEPGRGRTIRKCLRLSSAIPSAPDLVWQCRHVAEVPNPELFGSLRSCRHSRLQTLGYFTA